MDEKDIDISQDKMKQFINTLENVQTHDNQIKTNNMLLFTCQNSKDVLNDSANEDTVGQHSCSLES